MLQDAILEAVGPNGQVLVDVMPYLFTLVTTALFLPCAIFMYFDVGRQVEVLIGPQAPVPLLPPTENKIRFERVLVRFLIALLSKYSIVLFLDGIQPASPSSVVADLTFEDMQWVDSSTISLIENLMTNPQVKHLLLICSYRDNEVDNGHLFQVCCSTIT